MTPNLTPVTPWRDCGSLWALTNWQEYGTLYGPCEEAPCPVAPDNQTRWSARLFLPAVYCFCHRIPHPNCLSGRTDMIHGEHQPPLPTQLNSLKRTLPDDVVDGQNCRSSNFSERSSHPWLAPSALTWRCVRTPPHVRPSVGTGNAQVNFFGGACSAPYSYGEPSQRDKVPSRQSHRNSGSPHTRAIPALGRATVGTRPNTLTPSSSPRSRMRIADIIE